MNAAATRIRHGDFLRPELLADPYPLLASLRERETELAAERTGSVWLLRYDSVAAVLRDPRLTVGAIGRNLNRLAVTALDRDKRDECMEALQVRTDLLFYLDPPRHTALRRLLHGWFTPAFVETLRPRVETIVDELLAVAPPTFDLVEAVAGRLPAIVVAGLLGLPDEDAPLIAHLSDAMAATANRGRIDPRWTKAAIAATTAFRAHLEPHLESRRRKPREDLLTALVRARDAGICTDHELAGLCLSIAVGGCETTRGLIGSAVLTLLRHPEELARLRREPALLDSAIEEVIRFECPVQVTARIADEAIAIGGLAIRAGTLVECWIGAANRDPARFPEPDRFDIGRSPNRHLAFGLGHHHCLGFALAQLEAAAVLRALLLRNSCVCLASDEVQWRPSGMFRAPQAVTLSR